MTDDPRIREAKREIRARSWEGIERRLLLSSFETRVASRPDAAYTIVGHAAVFNSLSEDLGFREKIAPGAFASVLAKNPLVHALFNHNIDLPLASTANGTLRLAEDRVGLAYEAEVADTTYAADLRVLLDRGDVSQSSFAFRVARDGDVWTEDEAGLVRTITEISGLYDVSPVVRAAYAATDAATHSSHIPSSQRVEAGAQAASTMGDDGAPGHMEPAPLRAALARSLERNSRLLTG